MNLVEVLESAADDFVGDAEAARAVGVVSSGQFLPTIVWLESLIELASVWTSSADVNTVVGFLGKLRKVHMPCHATPCRAMPCCAVCRAMPCHVVP